MTTDNPYDLSGRVALITGASSHGIGNQSAKILAAHGAKVFLVARREEKLKDACAEIEAAGGVASYYAGDASQEETCKAAVEKCVADFGRLDIMVLAAGISGLSERSMEDAFDTENWRHMLAVNLDSVFFMVKHGWEECAKNGVGAIIPIGSLASCHAAGSTAYTATKGAVRALTQKWGKLLGPKGVRVNALYPGFIDTDMTHRATEVESYISSVIARIPLGRYGTVDDCANAVLYLASDASSFMNGQHLVIDGGELA